VSKLAMDSERSLSIRLDIAELNNDPMFVDIIGRDYSWAPSLHFPLARRQIVILVPL
jgi:hypothetical protein